MTEPMGERGRQGAAPLGGTDIETEGTCGVCGSEIVVADGRVVRVGKLLDPRIERVVEAAREAERHLTFNGWKDDPNSDRRFAAVTALREALGALDD